MKSLAVMGTPSDHTAWGFSVYTIVSGLVLTSSDCWMRFGFGVTSPEASTMNGLGSTAARSICVPAESPVGVLGLQPVGPWVTPTETDPPATPT